ncbi:FAD/NAD(P)-binding protein [Actinoallomurus bryophytorum]|uniref:FAD/NAD(P)-binding protein n=1 Tax=Actinoallomurus bryophytorum TaxID=1490222 RepID=UPI001639913B|nr:FAD/NAD(P)-binding protein [Actinoallomurus bryophytorum]
MSDSSARREDIPSVVIVGGGASGTLTAVHLIRGAQARGRSLQVVLVDRDGRHGLGQAYATTDPHHLLNAGAAKMSALADDPDHLLRWARGQGLNPAGSDFLPRCAYGRYLRELLDGCARRLPHGGRFTRLTATVTSLTTAAPGRPLRLRLSNGDRLDADAVVLATGNRPPGRWPRIEAGPRYVADPWGPGALTEICDGSPVLVIGTGLTMVDLATTATRANKDTVVYAISRHGLLPRRHRCPASPPAEISLPVGEVRLAELLGTVRTAIKSNGGDWHGVIDGLRPHVPQLWARLSIDDRRRFLASVARYWEVHRHRIPPATAAQIAGLRAAGRLKVLRGRLVEATAGRDEMRVRVDVDGVGRELRVGWLVNGTGPAAEITEDPFLGGLVDSGLVRPDPLRLGLDAEGDGAVLDAVGRRHDRIFALGPTLRGVRYETTAIPEIRAQAAALVRPLLETIAAGDPSHHASARTAGRPAAIA